MDANRFRGAIPLIREDAHLKMNPSESIRGLNGSHIESMMVSQGNVWNRDEHERFIHALETYGVERSGDEWQKITAYVQTRSIEEVRLHGKRYFNHLVSQMSRANKVTSDLHVHPNIQFQSISHHCNTNNQNDPNVENSISASISNKNSKSKGKQNKIRQTPQPSNVGNVEILHGIIHAGAAEAASALHMTSQQHQQPAQKLPNATKKVNRRQKVWTPEEDKVFETELASWKTGKPYSWQKIAATLPGKTAKDVRMRYEKLINDLSKIEKGEYLVGHQPTSVQKGNTNLNMRTAQLTNAVAAEDTAVEKFQEISVFPPPNACEVEIKPSISMDSSINVENLNMTTQESKNDSSFGSVINQEEKPISQVQLSSGIENVKSSLPSALQATISTAEAPKIWQDFLVDDFKFEVKGIASVDAVSPVASTHSALSTHSSNPIKEADSSLRLSTEETDGSSINILTDRVH